MTDEAQAVTAVATAAGKFVDLMMAVGSYAKDVVGTVPHNLIGLHIGDQLEIRRLVNLQRLIIESGVKLDGFPDARKSDPSPSVVLPLLAAAADEEREELRTLWSALLANAILDGGNKVRRDFFDVLRGLEPLDAAVFDLIGRWIDLNGGIGKPMPFKDVWRVCDEHKISVLDSEVALRALERAGCVEKQGPFGSANLFNVRMMPFGAALRIALSVSP